ncbi:MAG: hypothetical protein JSS63_13380 [Bacteroidetes bacterium]|nr:hypothetical protein [Bacteroidota bacterium]
MLGKLKANIISNLRNIPGWKTKRKILVFESDDWGTIRMPSKEVQDKLIKLGIKADQNYYNNNDSLESNNDLEGLFEVLTRYKDKNGRSAAFTPICLVANPDFQKIRDNNFKEYFYEPVTETLNKYGSSHNKVFQLWQEGIKNKIFVPQFHGREHLNVKRWMNCLNGDFPATKLCFDYNFFGLSDVESNEIRGEFLAAVDIDDVSENIVLAEIIKDGLNLFEKLLGYKAEYFVAPNSLMNTGLEKDLSQMGIKFLIGSRNQPESLGNGQYKTNFRYIGKKNEYGQTFLVRNSQFEHGQSAEQYGYEKCLKDIEAAFRWNKPAVISTHRVNYIGFINEKNRKQGLEQLDNLLKNVTKKWSDVEFMTSAELGELITQSADAD